MIEQIFIDSNIFLYTLDSNDQSKRETAKKLLLEASERQRIFISTQVLNEVYSVATKKMGVESVSAKEFVRSLQDLDVILVTCEIVQSAIDCSILNRLNYWDALMIAAAESAKCEQLWTEDMQHGQRIRGVEMFNPFLAR